MQCLASKFIFQANISSPPAPLRQQLQGSLNAFVATSSLQEEESPRPGHLFNIRRIFARPMQCPQSILLETTFNNTPAFRPCPSSQTKCSPFKHSCGTVSRMSTQLISNELSSHPLLPKTLTLSSSLCQTSGGMLSSFLNFHLPNGSSFLLWPLQAPLQRGQIPSQERTVFGRSLGPSSALFPVTPSHFSCHSPPGSPPSCTHHPTQETSRSMVMGSL